MTSTVAMMVRHMERPNDPKEMFGIFYVGGEGFDDMLEVGVDVC